MSPLLVIFAVTVGGAYFGVLGMFLAVPIMAVIKLLVEEFIEYRNNGRKEVIKEKNIKKVVSVDEDANKEEK